MAAAFDLLIEALKHIGDRRHIRRQTESRLHDMTNHVQHSEGTVARLIEEQTAKLPSDVFLWAAVGTGTPILDPKDIGSGSQGPLRGPMGSHFADPWTLQQAGEATGFGSP